MLLLCLTALADDLPPAPSVPVVSSQMTDPPEFGADASLGYAVGSLIGNWPASGVHGAVIARYEAFITPATAPGPRLGLSVWGSGALWPLQARIEDGAEDTFSYLHYGLITALRYDPEAPLSFTTGLGYGRLDLVDWYGGPKHLPTLTFEAGLRQRLAERPYLDWMARVHWATGRDPTGMGYEEWWMAQLAVSIGGHLR